MTAPESRMTCEMYFLLMPNLIVDSPGYPPVKGESPLASGTVVTLEWWPSSVGRARGLERTSRLNGRVYKDPRRFARGGRLPLSHARTVALGRPRLRPWKARACSVSSRRSPSHSQIVI